MPGTAPSRGTNCAVVYFPKWGGGDPKAGTPEGAVFDSPINIFNELALQPLLERTHCLERESEELGSLRAKTKAKGAKGPFEKMTSENVGPTQPFAARSLSEWVQFLLHQEPLAKVCPPRMLLKALTKVLTDHFKRNSATGDVQDSKIEAGVISECFPLLLEHVDGLVGTRVAEVEAELKQLDAEVEETEQRIESIFEKMDEEGEGAVTREQFVNFLCDEYDLENRGPPAPGTTCSMKDAETLFEAMSGRNGQGHKKLLHFETFKDQITKGGLQVLDVNLAQRRRSRQQFRDWIL